MVGKEFPAFPSHLKKRRSPQERREELQGRATISRVSQMYQSIQRNEFSLHSLHFQAEDQLPPRWYGDSPVGKPGGKASRESHRSLDPRKGKRDTAATAREESASACPHSRQGLTPLWRLQKYPKIHVSTGGEPKVPAPTPHKVLGPGIYGRGIPRGPRATRMGTGLS